MKHEVTYTGTVDHVLRQLASDTQHMRNRIDLLKQEVNADDYVALLRVARVARKLRARTYQSPTDESALDWLGVRRDVFMEINEAYTDVCVRRWQEFTGESAILEGGKQTFDQIAKRRAKQASVAA